MPSRSDSRPGPPYPLPPLPDPASLELSKVDLWEAMEFFHVEALLRSPKIWEKFESWQNLSQDEKADSDNDVLSMEYGIENGWKVLEGTHHWYLRPHEMIELGSHSVRFRFHSGVLNLSRYLRFKKEELNEAFSWEKVGEHIFDDRPRYLWVRIDAAHAHSDILKELKAELEARLPSVQEAASSYAPRKVISGIFPDFPYHAQRTPPIREAKAWLDYLRCYDLRQAGKTFGQVALAVYEDSEKRENAEKACDRVLKLIDYAERKHWPPPPGFHQ